MGATLAACSTASQVGLMVAPKANPGAIVTEPRGYTELGPTEGTACRYFVLGIVPFGDPTTGSAMQKALLKTGGDAIINATVTTSVFGFVPINTILSYTCTTVRGIAIQIAKPT